MAPTPTPSHPSETLSCHTQFHNHGQHVVSTSSRSSSVNTQIRLHSPSSSFSPVFHGVYRSCFLELTVKSSCHCRSKTPSFRFDVHISFVSSTSTVSRESLLPAEVRIRFLSISRSASLTQHKSQHIPFILQYTDGNSVVHSHVQLPLVPFGRLSSSLSKFPSRRRRFLHRATSSSKPLTESTSGSHRVLHRIATRRQRAPLCRCPNAFVVDITPASFILLRISQCVRDTVRFHESVDSRPSVSRSRSIP